MLAEVIRKGRLLDLYGALLTEKQQRCLDMYFNFDLSLSEIGEELKISRQGAYDMLHRASQTLEGYEAKLHLLARRETAYKQLEEVQQLLDEAPVPREKAKQLLQQIEL